MFLHYPRHGEVLTEHKYEDGKAQLKDFKTFPFPKNCIYNAIQLYLSPMAIQCSPSTRNVLKNSRIYIIQFNRDIIVSKKERSKERKERKERRKKRKKATLYLPSGGHFEPSKPQTGVSGGASVRPPAHEIFLSGAGSYFFRLP